MDGNIAGGHLGHAGIHFSARFPIKIIMLVLRKYQLDIIFLFVAFLIFIWLIFFLLKFIGADPHQYELFVAGPFLILYFAYLWKVRGEINLKDRRAMTGKSLVYWIILGITLFSAYSTPIAASDYLSIEILFLIFTLLLADSYWDFKNICLKSFSDRREIK